MCFCTEWFLVRNLHLHVVFSCRCFCICKVFWAYTEVYFLSYIFREVLLLFCCWNKSECSFINNNLVAFLLNCYSHEVHWRCSNEASNELVDWVVVQVKWFTNLLNVTVFHNNNLCTHCHSFDLVVCNVDHCSLESLVQSCDFTTHCNAELSIKVRKWFVEQEYFRVTNDCASYCNTLSLSTGKCLWFAVEVLSKSKANCCFINTAFDFSLVHFADLETESHVVIYCHMRIKSIVLEYHGDVSVLWWNVVHEFTIDKKFTFRNFFQTSDHTESC